MSLFEINSMIWALEKMSDKDGNDRPMSDDEFEASKERWRAMKLADVRI